jgi:hypothetical protein
VLAKLKMNRGSGPVVFAPGASHYRLIGLELTRVAGTDLVYALASPSPGVVTSKIIFDRIWFHGTVHDESTRGVQLGGNTYITIVDSFFTDFHCVCWRASNFFQTPVSAVEFVDYNGGSAGNYALQSTSPYKGAGTDGKDLGANVPAVNAAVAKVRLA